MQGQHYYAESGLYYNRYRYYDHWQGRYITQDPIGLRGGINFYSYPVNPILGIDPLGLFTCGICNSISDAVSTGLDNLLFNPTKMATAGLNAANAGRLYATGLIKMGFGVLANGIVVFAPAGATATAWGAWNIKLGLLHGKEGVNKWQNLCEKRALIGVREIFLEFYHMVKNTMTLENLIFWMFGKRKGVT